MYRISAQLVDRGTTHWVADHATAEGAANVAGRLFATGLAQSVLLTSTSAPAAVGPEQTLLGEVLLDALAYRESNLKRDGIRKEEESDATL